ncbi:MAG: hypothetical protein GTO12_01540 [Proteobacteria bacterium]|nr:hypothetical protein [Pseudomonadota bacterium]
MEESRSDMEKQIEKEIEKEIEKQVTDWVSVGISILVAVVVSFVVGVIVFKLVWSWVVPDLFPGAVAQGLIVEDLTWLDAVKLAVLAAVLSGFFPALSDAFKQRP